MHDPILALLLTRRHDLPRNDAAAEQAFYERAGADFIPALARLWSRLARFRRS